MSKPVAWTEKDLMNACRNARLTEDDFLRIKAYLPIYTHPVKQLSDEEIGKIWVDCMESPYMQVSNPVGFARAIIKEITE